MQAFCVSLTALEQVHADWGKLEDGLKLRMLAVTFSEVHITKHTEEPLEDFPTEYKICLTQWLHKWSVLGVASASVACNVYNMTLMPQQNPGDRLRDGRSEFNILKTSSPSYT